MPLFFNLFTNILSIFLEFACPNIHRETKKLKTGPISRSLTHLFKIGTKKVNNYHVFVSIFLKFQGHLGSHYKL